MSNFSGVSRPARAAGIGLLAVAVAAAVIGGVTVLTSGDSDDTAAPPTSSAPQEPPPGGSPPPGQPSPTTGTSPTTPSQPPSSTQPPGATSSQPGGPGGEPGPDQPGQPGDQQASAKWVSVRVYNNSTIKGLAHRAAADLRGQGWNVVETNNYSSGIIPTTTAYFRPGTDEESAARALGAAFGMRVEPRFAGIAQSSPGVIVIVTRDYEQSAAKGK